MPSPNFHLRLPPEMKALWQRAADREGRTLSNFIKAAVTEKAKRALEARRQR